MKQLTRDQIELLGIGFFVLFITSITWFLPTQLPLGEIVLYSAALLLFQGLIRDLAIKLFPPKTCAIGPGKSGDAKTCMCAESTLGTAGILAGAIMLLAFTTTKIPTPWFAWPIAALLIMIVGFLIKSIVIDWKNRRIMWIQDHRQIKT